MAGYGLVVGGLGWRAAPWQARRSYAGDIGALYLRQHESQGRAQRLLGLEMPQPASPPCRRHAAPLPVRGYTHRTPGWRGIHQRLRLCRGEEHKETAHPNFSVSGAWPWPGRLVCRCEPLYGSAWFVFGSV